MIQVVATASSSLTLSATLVTFYWFFRMEKRLRHELIMMSIFGCFLRGLWYFIFSIVVWRGKPVETHTGLCQASGFFINLGNEITDFATLFIAIHGALQIFKPAVATFDIQDGIYDWRKLAYAVTFLVPLVFSSIPFINGSTGYTMEGSAFCALPLSPMWYRLVLAWIPRFIIGLVIACLAIAVYIHVEIKFKGFAAAQRSSRTSIDTKPLSVLWERRPSLQFLERRKSSLESHTKLDRRRSLPILTLPQYDQKSSDKHSPLDIHNPIEVPIRVKDFAGREYFPQNFSSERKSSAGTVDSARPLEVSVNPLTVPPQLWMTARRSLSENSADTANVQRFGSNTRKSGGSPRRVSIQEPVKEEKPQQMKISPPLPEVRNDNERNALKNQLLLVFVYPIGYVVLWTPPSILNMMIFCPDQARHLPMWLTILSTLCLTLMGGVDCAVFLWREKPWRHPANRTWIRSRVCCCLFCTGGPDLESNNVITPTSSCGPSSMTGSSAPSRSSRAPPDGDEVAEALSTIQVLSRPRLRQLVHRSSTSHGSQVSYGSRTGGRTTAKKYAYERLALEKKDRREARRLSAGSKASDMSVGYISDIRPRKEWWDRKDSILGA